MRADRLLSLLMLLQAHGRLTARRLADELEVSERTIYRDIQALSTAGVPVYGLGGPDGGFELVDSYRTDLTGLSEGEARALFMLTIPQALLNIGVGQELKAALRKLSAALPDARRQDEHRVRQRFYIDPVGWSAPGSRPPADRPAPLNTIYQAVWQDRCLIIAYRSGPLQRVERLVQPYALAAKDGEWYLVYQSGGRLRVLRISNLLEVQSTTAGFARPDDFDLERYWRGWCEEVGRRQERYPVTVRVRRDFLPWVPHYFGAAVRERLDSAGGAAEVTFRLSFESLEAARDRLLGCGRAVEVLDPPALRRSLLDYAEQIVAIYPD